MGRGGVGGLQLPAGVWGLESGAWSLEPGAATAPTAASLAKSIPFKTGRDGL